MSETYYDLKQEVEKARDALGYLQKVLYDDAASAHPCRALSREVVNEALLMGGFEPIVDREISLI